MGGVQPKSRRTRRRGRASPLLFVFLLHRHLVALLVFCFFLGVPSLQLLLRRGLPGLLLFLLLPVLLPGDLLRLGRLSRGLIFFVLVFRLGRLSRGLIFFVLVFRLGRLVRGLIFVVVVFRVRCHAMVLRALVVLMGGDVGVALPALSPSTSFASRFASPFAPSLGALLFAFFVLCARRFSGGCGSSAFAAAAAPGAPPPPLPPGTPALPAQAWPPTEAPRARAIGWSLPNPSASA